MLWKDIVKAGAVSVLLTPLVGEQTLACLGGGQAKN